MQALVSTENKKFLTVTEFRNLLGISKSLSYKIIKTDGFPLVVLGSIAGSKRIMRIPIDELNDWLSNQNFNKEART